ncbi:hypothetical protein FEE96_21255 [Parasedimentitalea maritima]|uniref:Uncharacterized protein n=1 Tax=Parasedimentitalea maritima TaxID=2578117 RepID=A0ABY2UR41_9RHOB|nr:hypothetical protein [Zongyanglinia marina]TLP56498.1 hypothetical protein FEE96_21255 [Zongyanglinia marina]
MTDFNPQTHVVLSDDELAFQADPASWRYGPTFDVRFFFNHSLNFADFETALLNDPLRIIDPRFDTPSRVLLRHEQWPNCVGARYYDFQRPNRREPTILFYPRQYKTILDGMYFSRGRREDLSKFLDPIISLALRIKTACDAHEVMLFTQDFYPGKSPETEILPGVFLAEPIFEAMR